MTVVEEGRREAAKDLRERVYKLTMPDDAVIEAEYPNGGDWAKSWSIRYPPDMKVGTTGEQDWELVERYGLTAILDAAILALNPVEGVGMRYSASGDHVVDADERNTFQVVPINRIDGDSLAIGVAEAMNAALSTPVAAQGDEVREALEIIFREWDARTDPSAEMPGWPDDPAAVMNDAWKNGFYDKAKAALATLGAPHEG